MNGAIFFSGEYGSTAQYANWIGEATGLPVFDVGDSSADPSKYEFLILGSSVILYRLKIRKWVKANRAGIENKPTILFTVSGAPAGPKLDGWVAASLPDTLLARMEHIALRGRLDHAKISCWIRMFLSIGALMNTDPEGRRDELEGFDYVDKSSIDPILHLAEQFRSR